jgi:hypothetical protein
VDKVGWSHWHALDGCKSARQNFGISAFLFKLVLMSGHMGYLQRSETQDWPSEKAWEDFNKIIDSLSYETKPFIHSRKMRLVHGCGANCL